MYTNNKRLIILDADGTTIDAFSAIDKTFSRHSMAIGDEESFQKRRHIFKYLGGLRDFPANIKKQIGKQSRKQIIATLTEVYRDEAQLYPQIAGLIQSLIAAPDIVVGLVTRNITNQPEETLRQLFRRHDIDLDALDFFIHIPVGQEKTDQFRATRERFEKNPARSYICGDEYKDFLAGINSGMHPFMVSYGFESHKRLTKKFKVPEEIISRSSKELCDRVRHGLGLAELR